MTKFNLSALAAISIAFSMIPLAFAHETGAPHAETSASRKSAPALSGSKLNKIASKNSKARKGQTMSQKGKMDPSMKM
jgi:hypothetical protein